MNSVGQLTHLITIQKNSNDGTHDPIPSDWQTVFADVWAAKQGLTGRLYYAAAAAQSENDVIFKIHYSPDYASQIRAEMRIVADGNTIAPYRITSEPVNDGDANLWLELHARRVDQNGGA